LKHIEASMRQWIDTMGVRPFVCITDRTIDITYQGHERSLQQTHAFGFIGEVQIELIYQTNDIPSPYQDFLAGGRQGLNHLGFWVEQPDTSAAQLEEAGFPTLFVVDLAGQIIRFYDSPSLGTAVEVIPIERKAFREALIAYLLTADADELIHRFATIDDFYRAVS